MRTLIAERPALLPRLERRSRGVGSLQHAHTLKDVRKRIFKAASCAPAFYRAHIRARSIDDNDDVQRTHTSRLLEELIKLGPEYRTNVMQMFGALLQQGEEDNDAQELSPAKMASLQQMLASAQAEFKAATEDSDDLTKFEFGRGVDEFIKLIEDGRKLPPIPADEIISGPEDVASFKQRWERSFQEFAELAEQAGMGPSKRAPPKKKEKKKRGGDTEESQPRLDWRGPFDRVPIKLDEILGHMLAPDLPEDIESVMENAERCAFVLRRGHKSLDVEAPLRELRERGLVSEHLTYRDPFMDLQGLDAVVEYFNRMQTAGMESELCKQFMRCAPPKRRSSLPHWEVIVDAFLHVPYPAWYTDYVFFQGSENVVIDGTTGGNTAVSNTVLPPGGIGLYPRSAALEHIRRNKMKTKHEAEQEEGCSLMNEKSRSCLRARDVLAAAHHAGESTLPLHRRPVWVVKAALPLEDEAPRNKVGLILGRLGHRASAFQSYYEVQVSSVFDDLPYAAMLAIDGITNLGYEGAWAPAMPLPSQLDSAPPTKGKKRIQRKTIRRWPEAPDPDAWMTREEAEAALHGILGGKFDSIMAQMPTPGRNRSNRTDDPGTRWQGGECFTVSITLRYAIDPVKGQVEGITCNWGAASGTLVDAFAASDIFVRSTGALWDGLDDD